jgi:hypothetical protein
LQSLARFIFLALIIQVPFELRYTLFGLSNLQWTFVLLLLASLPTLIANWKSLASDRLVQATAVFVALQWLAAAYAPEFHTNAFKAAARFTVGFLLVAITKHVAEATKAWAIAAIVAAVYALSDYSGFGLPWLFRTDEFYIGQIQRLSGSFEYPNVAATYFAMSLPIVWWNGFRPVLRLLFAFVICCTIVLTFSKAALAAVPLVALIAMRKSAIPLVATGVAAYVALLPLNPYLIERIFGPARRNPIAVEYKTDWNQLQQQPAASDALSLEIHNTGITTLRSGGHFHSSLGYRWWSMETENFISGTPLITPLSQDVSRGETIRLPVAFQTPVQPGKYLLVAELFSRNLNWYSRMGVVPAIVYTEVQPGVSRTVGHTDLSSIYNRGQDPTTLTAAVPRLSLWQAALKMFVAHPFGVGPDNFRLWYGRYLGATHWNTKVYSNNLYLELLTGSGIFGLAAFAWVITARRWNRSAASLAVAIFLIHGIVDVFLMTTPIYFAFWILMPGRSHRD